MARWFHGLTLALLAASVVLACGGRSTKTRVIGGGSAGSSSQPRTCRYAGKTYQDGDTFEASDGCNSCSCDDGAVGCTEIGCSQPPRTCQDVQNAYIELLTVARQCDPAAPDQCTARFDSDLSCGCATFVNGGTYTEEAQKQREYYAELGCGEGSDCHPCAGAVRGFCNVEGRCMDATDIGGEPGCRVAGVVYASGAMGIPNPAGCGGDCQCDRGDLKCSALDCSPHCARGLGYAISCAQCGPSDACEVFDYGCRPTCLDGVCAEGVCLNGVCLVDFCG